MKYFFQEPLGVKSLGHIKKSVRSKSDNESEESSDDGMDNPSGDDEVEFASSLKSPGTSPREEKLKIAKSSKTSKTSDKKKNVKDVENAESGNFKCGEFQGWGEDDQIDKMFFPEWRT